MEVLEKKRKDVLLRRDINVKSPYCKQIQCESRENWRPVFPEFNVLLFKGNFFGQV